MASQNPSQELVSISEVANTDAVPVTNPNPAQETVKAPPVNPDIPPPKTDKPRPHVCTTCTRSFARLEHLKRHERSHTKEKPFECPECSRCFARRDLLLRHQQKLHLTSTPSSRPRNARRESTSGAATSRVRKNSIANGGSNNMRPRANTISHVDGARVGMLASATVASSRPPPSHGHHPSLSSVSGFPSSFDPRTMSSESHHHHHPPRIDGLAKLDTSGIPLGLSNGLRTAPVLGSFNPDLQFHDFMPHDSNTINPAQLHFSGSPLGFTIDTPTSPFHPSFSGMSTTHNLLDDDPNFDWVNGFDTNLTFANANESAIDGSSPSAMSTGSQSGVSEAVLDSTGHGLPSCTGPWSNPLLVQTQTQATQFHMDFTPAFPDLAPQDGMSPKSLLIQNQFPDTSFSTPPPLASMSPSGLSGLPAQMFHPPMAINGDAPGSVNGSLGQGNYLGPSATPNAIDTITESTRQALLIALQQPSGFNSRRFSHGSNGVSMSGPGTQSRSFQNGSFPRTTDLQRYIVAYINYFHPHMPFLHIPTLDFGSPEFTSRFKMPNAPSNMSSSSVAGGAGCLILSMAAIGALYEFETETSKELFEYAKKMIQLYLEERRKADMSAALNRSNPNRDSSVHNTPLWLVQSMLLNVIYGHNSGDKTSADIASTHCAALVSLARAAGLIHSLPAESLPPEQLGYTYVNGDVQLNGNVGDMWSSHLVEPPEERRGWLKWKIVEERKRTLYAIYTLSSLLVSAYNHPPAIINSEIDLDLPCEERLWAAESPQAWRAMGGSVEQTGVRFAVALGTLLTASRRRPSADNPEESPLRPSTFGCLVLIHALHNYIWDTRERHLTQPWTSQEIEVMHAKIEPALRAWQGAWGSNPHHSLERPNPYGLGPLSADSIPLLDLAYVRLFVNLGRSKEAFWQRDWNGMADELARGTDIVLYAGDSPGTEYSANQVDQTNQSNRQGSMGDFNMTDLDFSSGTSQHQGLQDVTAPHQPVKASKRERHLRKAAHYAADSISMSDKLGNTYMEFTSRELPIQSAMCMFDCAQVLAEWITAVQERVGPYLGILGQDMMDLNQVPAVLLLEDEDYKLIQKIEEVLNNVEQKMKVAIPDPTSSGHEASNCLPSLVDGGYGIKILYSTAYLLNRAAVWPVTKLMARSLEAQGRRIRERAQNSVMVTR